MFHCPYRKKGVNMVFDGLDEGGRVMFKDYLGNVNTYNHPHNSGCFTTIEFVNEELPVGQQNQVVNRIDTNEKTCECGAETTYGKGTNLHADFCPKAGE